MARILIIDDDEGFREGLCETVADLGHVAVSARDAEEGLQVLTREAFDAVLLDQRMPGKSGIELLEELARQPNHPPVVMLTAFASSRNTIDAMKLGAFDHLTKPVKREQVIDVLRRMLESRRPSRVAAIPSEESFVGVSDEIREVEKLIGLAASSDATVLVTGETGTGKEVVARALHDCGDRAKGAFIAVNCAAIPPDLLESELFGHRRGAFTGATADKAGCFQLADGGTLLLDEIGDMTLAMQAKILRALQTKEVTPVGATKAECVDTRVVAATHRNLKEAVAKGAFREDLFYRLNVFPIHLPPLRERPRDILPLAHHFLGGGKTLTPRAEERLTTYSWPGNVRELKNAIERASLLARGGAIDDRDFFFLDETRPDVPFPDAILEMDLPSAVGRLERMLIQRALQIENGNRSEAAKRLGINRQLLYTKLKDLRLDE